MAFLDQPLNTGWVSTSGTPTALPKSVGEGFSPNRSKWTCYVGSEISLHTVFVLNWFLPEIRYFRINLLFGIPFWYIFGLSVSITISKSAKDPLTCISILAITWNECNWVSVVLCFSKLRVICLMYRLCNCKCYCQTVKIESKLSYGTVGYGER